VIVNGVATVTVTGTATNYITVGDILYFRNFKDASSNELKYNGFSFPFEEID
jgi:hypothetical protein